MKWLIENWGTLAILVFVGFVGQKILDRLDLVALEVKAISDELEWVPKESKEDRQIRWELEADAGMADRSKDD